MTSTFFCSPSHGAFVCSFTKKTKTNHIPEEIFLFFGPDDAPTSTARHLGKIKKKVCIGQQDTHVFFLKPMRRVPVQSAAGPSSTAYTGPSSGPGSGGGGNIDGVNPYGMRGAGPRPEYNPMLSLWLKIPQRERMRKRDRFVECE